MLDPLFPFADHFVDPVVELSEDNRCFVIPVEILLDFMKKAGIDKKAASVPEGATLEIPLDVVMSLLRPEELEKLQKYIAAYLAKYPDG
jgi:hypothetical protein